jgi:alkaline phosphatase D
MSLTTHSLSRRAFIKGAAAIAVGSAFWFDHLLASVTNDNVTKVFTYGVASGEPQPNSVLLWTRVNPNEAAGADVYWEIAESPTFERLTQSGKVHTDQARDYTVKVVVTSLKPNSTYYYRFRHGQQYSEIGRTKTLPTGSLDKVTFAVASCSNYAFGLFNAYEDIAQQSDVDYVLHLGDYIYEYGQDGWGSDVAQQRWCSDGGGNRYCGH